jgi:hypothetical protein
MAPVALLLVKAPILDVGDDEAVVTLQRELVRRNPMRPRSDCVPSRLMRVMVPRLSDTLERAVALGYDVPGPGEIAPDTAEVARRKPECGDIYAGSLTATYNCRQ